MMEGARRRDIDSEQGLIRIHTPDEYSYRIVENLRVKGTTTIVFEVLASNDAHILLMNDETDIDTNVYEIVIGAGNNTFSAIRQKRLSDNIASKIHKPLDCNTERQFWVSWGQNTIKVGSGKQAGENEFLSYKDSGFKAVNYAAVSTGWGATGEWIFYNEIPRQSKDYPGTLVIHTPDQYKYQLVKDLAVQETTSIVFEVRASNDAHILLMQDKGDFDRNIYEIVIGAGTNSFSTIRKERLSKDVTHKMHHPLSCYIQRYFWISWNGKDGKTIKLGSGQQPGENEILSYTDSGPRVKVNYAAVSTGWGATGDWLFYNAVVTDPNSYPGSLCIHTPNEYKYRIVDGLSVQETTSMVFKVRASNDAHILLMHDKADIDRNIFEIVIGAGTNSFSTLRTERLKKDVATKSHHPLCYYVQRYFWVSWELNTIKVGKGRQVGTEGFLSYAATSGLKAVNYIAVSTGWGASGDWVFFKGV